MIYYHKEDRTARKRFWFTMYSCNVGFMKKKPKVQFNELQNGYPNSKILFVDDVITTGHSILKGIESVSYDSVIRGIVVLVDRQQGSQDLFDQFSLKIKSAIPILRIIKILNDNDRIDKNDYNNIKEELVKS